MPRMKLVALLSSLLCFTVACNTPPKAEIPALTPDAAAALLQLNPKAKVWLEHIQKQNPACSYKLDLPDQSSNPVAIDIDHAVSCGNRPSPREFDATVSFAYDKAAGHWVISRFAS